MDERERQQFYEKAGLVPAPHPEAGSVSDDLAARVQESITDPTKPLTREERNQLENEGAEVIKRAQAREQHFRQHLEQAIRQETDYVQRYGDWNKGQGTEFHQTMGELVQPALQDYVLGQDVDFVALAKRINSELAMEASMKTGIVAETDPADEYCRAQNERLQSQRGYGSSPDCGRSASQNSGLSARAEGGKR